ncbi:MAG: hypothetical protein KGZ42_02105 [Melioribacter sp.]|nr:hypothetical protein [Melioribacter sp.]
MLYLLIILAAAFIAGIIISLKRAPLGYEDANGFHYYQKKSEYLKEQKIAA